MELKLHNTLTREKEVFKPIDPANVRMYCCGPTVYNYAHIGNGRAAVVADLLNRLLRHIYGEDKVKFVRNITDVDDKIMNAARESGESIDTITRKYEKIYNEDMAALGCRQPDVQPRCTEHIPQMVSMIETLLKRNHAYEAEGNVLFSVPSMPEYGQLSRKNRDELIAGARVDVAPYKKDAADFVLWKPSTPEQVGWDSPWGRGRPGWHIECSAMSKAHLGETFDIHAGGLDLIFPHHENEIAQSRCAHDSKVMANYWVHNGFLNMGDEKMSKSLGNVMLVHDLLKKWPGEVLRLALLSAHYRQPLNFTEDLLAESKAILDDWYSPVLGPFDEQITPSDLSQRIDEIEIGVIEGLYDDLNTRSVMPHLFKLNSLCRNLNPDVHSVAKPVMKKWLNFLGLATMTSDEWFHWRPKGGMSADEIDQKVTEYAELRKNKRYSEADALRQELTELHAVNVSVTPMNTTWSTNTSAIQQGKIKLYLSTEELLKK